MTNSIDYQLYREEIINFLSTLCIKFDLFASRRKQLILSATGLTIDDKDNPYYINLCGDYSPYDTQMFVTAIETGEKVLFSKDLKRTNPKTFGLYYLNSEEYKNLCKEYPSQVGLIKSIIYPAKDMDTVLSARNLTVLAGDYSFLHINEQESIKQCVAKTLDVLYHKWYIADYEYEPGYILVFMAETFHALFNSILTQRVKNIRTEYVHPLHIWEYLDAKGLSDYRDVLSNRQALFLYRNMEYIINNKGKKSTLSILAKNILGEIYVELVGKTILQDSEIFKDRAITRPEFLEDGVIITTIDDTETDQLEDTSQILSRMYTNGYLKEISSEYIDRREYEFSRTDINRLPTRILDFKKLDSPPKYLSFVSKYLFDSLLYQLANGNLLFPISFKDPVLGLNMNITLNEALILTTYAYHVQLGIEPTFIPKSSQISWAIKKDRPVLLENFNSMSINHILKNIVDVDKIVDNLSFINESFTSQSTFINILSTQFLRLIESHKAYSMSCDLIYRRGMRELFRDLRERSRISNILSPFETYKEAIGASDILTLITNTYNDLPSNKESYSSLADTLLNAMFPVDGTPFMYYINEDKNTSVFYKKLKELFIQLCSYRLAFLDTSSTTSTYLNFVPTGVSVHEYTITLELPLSGDPQGGNGSGGSSDITGFTWYHDHANIRSTLELYSDYLEGMLTDNGVENTLSMLDDVPNRSYLIDPYILSTMFCNMSEQITEKETVLLDTIIHTSKLPSGLLVD